MARLSDSGNMEIEDIQQIDWIRELLPARTKLEQELLKERLKSGQKTPVYICTFDGKDNVLIDGHGRVQALTELNKTQVRFLRRKDLKTRADIEAFMLKEQIGERNLTPQKSNYVMGQLASHSNEVDTMSSSLTHEQIADIFQVSTKTVQRALKYYLTIKTAIENGSVLDELFELSIKDVIDGKTSSNEVDTMSSEPTKKQTPKAERPKLKFTVKKETRESALKIAKELNYTDTNTMIEDALELLKETKKQ